MKDIADTNATPEWYDDIYRAGVLEKVSTIAAEYELTLEELKTMAPTLYGYVNGSPKYYGKALRELCALVACAKVLKQELEEYGPHIKEY